MASNFDFLAKYWPDIAQLGKTAELYLYADAHSLIPTFHTRLFDENCPATVCIILPSVSMQSLLKLVLITPFELTISALKKSRSIPFSQNTPLHLTSLHIHFSSLGSKQFPSIYLLSHFFLIQNSNHRKVTQFQNQNRTTAKTRFRKTV